MTSPSEQAGENNHPKCLNCKRRGHLVCQKVIPNRWNEQIKKFVFEPRVFRHYLCSWHIGAENNPNHWDYSPGNKRKRVAHLADQIVIEQWSATEKEKGKLTDKHGWQYADQGLNPVNSEGSS